MSTSQGRTVMVQGRIVWTVGDLFKGSVKTVYGTQTPQLNQQGEQRREYGFGLAVPKSVLNQIAPGQPGEVWAAMHEEAYTLFPSRQIPPTFSMKYKDGDGVDDKGISFSQREGYAGHIVLACKTEIPIKWFKYENGQNIMVNEGFKCGDYVKVQLSIKAHPAQGSGKAGLYMNPMAVQFLGFGKEIVNAPSGDQIFGNQAPAVPAGASATPFDPQPGQMLVPQPAPAMPAAPHYGVLPNQFQPQAPMAPQGFPAPAMPQAPMAPQGFPAPAMPAVPGFPVPR